MFQVWDLRRSYDLYSGIPKPKFTIPYAGKYALNGYSSLILDSSKTKLYASCKGLSHSILYIIIPLIARSTALYRYVSSIHILFRSYCVPIWCWTIRKQISVEHLRWTHKWKQIFCQNIVKCRWQVGDKVSKIA